MTEAELKQLNNWFSYHSPNPSQITDYQTIRNEGLRFAQIVMNTCPSSADRSDAIRKIREAVMTANASIACDGQ